MDGRGIILREDKRKEVWLPKLQAKMEENRPSGLKNLITKCSVVLFLSISILYSQTVVRITVKNTNILDSPSFQGQIIGQARQGEAYTLQGSQGKWYKILLPDGKAGWILVTAGRIEVGAGQPSKPIQKTPVPSPYYQTPAPPSQAQPSYREPSKVEDYLLGKQQGEIDGGKELDCVWMGAGGLFGCLGVAAAFAFPPSEPSSLAMIGKSPDYQRGYRDGFVEAKGKAQVKSALIGWGVWIAAVLAIMLYGGGE